MAAKKYKTKKSSTKKEPPVDDLRRQWPWSELPPTNYSSIHLCSLQYNLRHSSTSTPPAVTKSWLPTTTMRCTHQRPQLRHVTTGPSQNPSPHSHKYRYRFLDNSCNIAESLYEMPHASHWSYLKLDTNPKFQPPSTINSFDPKLRLNCVNLGPDAPSSSLVVDYTVYNQHSGGSWWNRYDSIRYECSMADPFDANKKMMEYSNLVHSYGKYYATSLQGALSMMQLRDMRLVITAVGPVRAVPSIPWRYFKEYMVEMKGEIYLVFLIHENSTAVVDNVEVFRLDPDTLGLIKVERLGGRTMFLNERCVWMDCAENFGWREDHVYFTQGLDSKDWRAFDMKKCCISDALKN